MVVSLKDIFKMIGIIIMMACASLIATLFINYNIDLGGISDQIQAGPMQALYDAQMMSGKVVVGTAGGCLVVTTFIMLLFYIKFYIDGHKSELGILKALGYSNFEISKGFYKFGLSVFIGTLIGYLLAHLLMGTYYDSQLEGGMLPLFEPSFNFILFVFVVLIPTIFFCLVSVAYAYIKLKQPALDLIKGKTEYKVKTSKKQNNLPFLKEIKKNTLRQKKSLAFFVGFAVFCFSAMMQMSANIGDIIPPLLGNMMFVIGITISSVIMILAMSTLISQQRKNIGMMRVFGYQMSECRKNILDCYRPIAYVCFFIGTFYQYFLLKIMLEVVFKDIEVPDFSFNLKAFGITLISFLVLYEVLLAYYSHKVKKLPIKEIMLEAE